MGGPGPYCALPRLALLFSLLQSCCSRFGEREGGAKILQPDTGMTRNTSRIDLDVSLSLARTLAAERFVFGFSTGYVGSTTFSNEATYEDGPEKDAVLFEFERFHRNSKRWHHTHDDENNTFW